MSLKSYSELTLKTENARSTYQWKSSRITEQMKGIMKELLEKGENKIEIITNLKKGLPMENINKIAGPICEAWAQEKFEDISLRAVGNYNLKSVIEGERLDMADMILEFKDTQCHYFGNVDSKATSKDIANSGKSPNITSFERIRDKYHSDPNYIFIILSLKHKIRTYKDTQTGKRIQEMEIVDYNVYDLKTISYADISYNPALGTGQLQIRDIHNVIIGNADDNFKFCQMLDKKYINSKKGYDNWLLLAIKNNWIAIDEEIEKYVRAKVSDNKKEWTKLAKFKGWN